MQNTDEFGEIFSDIGEVAGVKNLRPGIRRMIADHAAAVRSIDAAEDVRIRLADTLKFIFTPGKTLFTDGEKGRGKTHQAIAFSEILTKGELYPEAGRYEVIGNVLMLQRIGDTGFDDQDFIESCPSGYHFATSLVEMLEAVADILERDRHTRIIWILDEVQNYIPSERSTTHISVMILQLLGVIRKLNLIPWMLSPTTANVSYRVRNFNDAPKDAGNVNVLWSFDYAMAEAYIRINGLNTKPYQYTTAQHGYRGRKHLFFVPVTSYTRPLRDLKVGEYAYDHTYLASFEIGHEKFSMTRFLARFKGIQSAKVPGIIRQYLKELGGESGDADTSADTMRRDRMDRVDRLRSQGRPWREIGSIEGIPWKTIYNQFKKFHGLKDGELLD